jgi:abortive infection bacteriophage resistance protein
MTYSKPWKSYEEQLHLLLDRGLQVSDRSKALEYLARIGYYRLSGYWFPFRERSGALVLLDIRGRKPARLNKVETIALDSFKAGATFENAVKLYVFDKQVRLLVMDALERIEIALRVDISHILGKLNRFAYLQPTLFHPDFGYKLDKNKGVSGHHEWLGKHAQLISRSKEEFVRHNHNGRVFASWLRSLNYLRNVCAHHSRLWNRNIVDQPKLPSVAEVPWVASFEHDPHAKARCYLLLCIANHLLQVINPNSSWTDRMKGQLQSFPDLGHLGLNLAGMGAPEGWEAQW